MIPDQRSSAGYGKWDAPGAQAVFLLIHGIGAHTGRWEPMADFFISRKISSFALALRGFGDTPGIKGHIDSFNVYLWDILSLVRVIRNDYPLHKIFLVGESLGGLIGFLMAVERSDLFGGLVCLSPAFADSLNIDIKTFWDIVLSSFIQPTKQYSVPVSLSCCSRDDDLVKRFDSDPREHRVASSRLLVETRLAQERAKIFKDKLSLPVLFLLSGHDVIVSTDESIRIFHSLKAADKMMKVYPQMYHALSIDVGREEVFEDVYGWVKKRI
ncbi:MAG: lysophospholipase [Candidatus Omnitrophica bacterium]|nr:lysophospholipase [Candidatus Omnitrophota bacterium]